MFARLPAACSAAPARLATTLNGCRAEASRLAAQCRRVPLRPLLALACLLAIGGGGMWAVLALAQHLSAWG